MMMMPISDGLIFLLQVTAILYAVRFAISALIWLENVWPTIREWLLDTFGRVCGLLFVGVTHLVVRVVELVVH